MSDPDETVTPPDDLPETLVEQLDSLTITELKSVQSYIEQLIDANRTPLEAEIEATAAGEVLEIDNQGTYALVRMHPPEPDGSGLNRNRVSLYHVRRTPQMDGTSTVRWEYQGDIESSEEE